MPRSRGAGRSGDGKEARRERGRASSPPDESVSPSPASLLSYRMVGWGWSGGVGSSTPLRQLPRRASFAHSCSPAPRLVLCSDVNPAGQGETDSKRETKSRRESGKASGSQARRDSDRDSGRGWGGGGREARTGTQPQQPQSTPPLLRGGAVRLLRPPLLTAAAQR